MITRSPLRVLLVDDEPSILRMFRTALANYGHEAEGVQTIAAACACLDAQAFDVIVSDVNMPGGTGFELLAAIRTRAIGIPIIIMTGRPPADFVARALAAGAFRAVIKPIMPPALRDVIESVVTEHRAERAAAAGA